ncbi:hypothetical protein VTK26DRAFT_7658 [Humicola hyalothermophila]
MPGISCFMHAFSETGLSSSHHGDNGARGLNVNPIGLYVFDNPQTTTLRSERSSQSAFEAQHGVRGGRYVFSRYAAVLLPPGSLEGGSIFFSACLPHLTHYLHGLQEDVIADDICKIENQPILLL